jgi:ApaG protein
VTSPEAISRGIRVRVETQYRPEYSAPAQNRWFFAYRIRIENEGTETVQLISRRWEITDAHGRVRFVEGLGVVGQQPILEPGTAFEYTSACPLETPFGSMHGTYQLTTRLGESFEAEIPDFMLSMPGSVN